MPATSVLWPRNGVYMGLPNPPKMAPPQCTRFSLQDWPAHPQACNCLFSSRRTCTAPLVAADWARACVQLPVLAGATWPCAWLLPCTGPAPQRRPFQLQRRAGGNQAWQERSPAMLPLLCPSPQECGRHVRGCLVVAAQGAQRKVKCLGATAYLLSALGKIYLYSPSSRADASK